MIATWLASWQSSTGLCLTSQILRINQFGKIRRHVQRYGVISLHNHYIHHIRNTQIHSKGTKPHQRNTITWKETTKGTYTCQKEHTHTCQRNTQKEHTHAKGTHKRNTHTCQRNTQKEHTDAKGTHKRNTYMPKEHIKGTQTCQRNTPKEHTHAKGTHKRNTQKEHTPKEHTKGTHTCQRNTQRNTHMPKEHTHMPKEHTWQRNTHDKGTHTCHVLCTGRAIYEAESLVRAMYDHDCKTEKGLDHQNTRRNAGRERRNMERSPRGRARNNFQGNGSE